MPVIINRSDGTALTTLEDAELDTNSSSIALFGIGGSGEDLIDKINENFVHIVENFASAVPPVSPQRGQLWYQLVNDYGGLIGPPLDYQGVNNPGSPEPAKSQLMIYNGVKWETLLDHYGTKIQDKLDELAEDYGTGVAGPGNDYLINPEIQLLYDRLEEFQTRYDALIESGFAKLDDLGAQVDRTLSESTQGVYDGIDRLDLAVTNGQEALNTGLATLDGLINGEGGLRDDVNDLYDQISLVDPAFGTPGRRIIELEEISNTSVTRISAMESVVGLSDSQGLRSRISNLEQTVTDGGVATATRVDALETVVFNPETGVVNLGSRLLQSEETIADLPNQYASTTRVGLLESFVNDPVTGNEQLGARISSAEQTITDLPNNYASTTRVSNLESTVNAANGGNANLLSRISSVETTFANGTYATSTRVGQLESRVGLTDGSGLSARILSAETTLVDIPNNYASTTRVTNLESTVNAGTGGVLDLRARVGSIETTFANGVYAEASRVTALESIVGTGEGGDNLVARIGTVESTVANINQNYATSTRVSTIETLVNNPTTGVTNLGSRIGSVETTIVNLPTNYTSAARGTALESLVNAGTGGILNLRSRLGTTESTIADLPNQYTSASRGSYLESIVGTSTGSGLQSRVGSIETTVSSLAENYTSASRGSFLESQVGLTANAAGSLRARVGTIETTFANNVYATSTRVATLESRVGLTDGVGLSARIVSAETTIANLPANYASASQYNSLVSQVNLRIKSYRQNDAPTSGMAAGDIWWDTNDNNRMYQYASGAWQEVTDPRTAVLLTEVINARGGQSSLTARFSNLNDTLVDQINQRATASSVSSLSTTVGGHTTTINSHTTSINGIMGEYGLYINNNGILSGWSLNSTLLANGAVESAMKIQVDRLQVVNSTGSVTSTPFEIVGGGVYMKTAMIRELSVNQLTAGTMTANMNVGTTKLRIDGTVGRIVISD